MEKDLTNLIRHYRNNPSIVMWCIGNEVPDQWNGNNGPKLSRMLQDICHREDPTRPVTQGMDAPDAVVNNNMAAVMDVAVSITALINIQKTIRNCLSRLF